jgi:hypothetical protein
VVTGIHATGGDLGRSAGSELLPNPRRTQHSAITTAPAAANDEALRHFVARLAFETDVSDVAADLTAGVPGTVVVDSRNAESWRQGHVRVGHGSVARGSSLTDQGNCDHGNRHQP